VISRARSRTGFVCLSKPTVKLTQLWVNASLFRPAHDPFYLVLRLPTKPSCDIGHGTLSLVPPSETAGVDSLDSESDHERQRIKVRNALGSRH
jgi:hypothetical protein